MQNDYLKMVLKAPVYDVAKETPLDPMPSMSQRINNFVSLKREDMQPVFSYKLRGAYTLMASLSVTQREQGVITASAGNHAQGVALAAKKLGIKALIVMPKTTPEIKIASVRQLEAEIILHGNTYDDASEHAHGLAKARQLTYIPPYDHPLVIAGQGTVGMEIMRQHRGMVDAIFVPVGGGGLIAGVGAYVKEISPETKIIGVEAEESAYVDEVLVVGIDEICAAVKDIFEDTRSIAEPSGALALAGIKQWVKRERVENRHLVAIFSGANVNFDRLRHIAELAELGEQREALIAATIPEEPGSFRKFCHALGPRAITEFNYRYSDNKKAVVFAGIRFKDGNEERGHLLSELQQKNFNVEDITDNELAKDHIRYMVGGPGGSAGDENNERILRVEFPERPGALLHFLNLIQDRWNISLFHYRNHGAAYGKVLMGIQIPPAQEQAFQAFLSDLEMPFTEERNNPAYNLFLR